jgi:hypothetical protein
VAPANEEELHENGELVIYTVSKADGSYEYRVYGTIGDDEPCFYACDENGSIIGKVTDISVEWDSSQYDKERIGEEQKLAASWSDAFSYSGEEIYASVTVSNMTKEEADAAVMEEENEDSEEINDTAPSLLAAPRSALPTYEEALAETRQHMAAEILT